MTERTISTTAMTAHIAAARALPLLPEGVPSPVQHAGRWWAIPATDDAYRPVSDPAVIAQLDHDAQRFHRARTASATGDKPRTP